QGWRAIPGGPGLRQGRRGAGLLPHGRQGPVRRDARRSGGRHRRRRLRPGRLRLPVTNTVTRTVRSTYRWTVSSTQMIDWDLAISTGTRWARPGPQVSLAEARRTVTELRDLAGAVQQPVYEVTGMSANGDGSLGRVAVVDRPGWIKAHVDGFCGDRTGVLKATGGCFRRPPGAAGRPAAGTDPGRGRPVPARLGDQLGGVA